MPHGRPTWVVDPNGVATAYTYDERGRVTETRVAAGTSDEAVTVHEYDADGNLEYLTAPNGVVTKYQYDTLGQLTRLIDRQIGDIHGVAARLWVHSKFPGGGAQ